MAFDGRQYPYNDRFKPEDQRTKVLFRPDRPLQQAELNELQSIMEARTGQMGEALFTDGNMQSGMAFRIDKDRSKLIVEPGYVYLGGSIRAFDQQEVDFKGEGTELIGVKLSERVITHVEDPSLLDQTAGVESAFSPGADRLEQRVVLSVNDTEAYTIYRFEEGDLFINPDNPEVDKINKVLAQRTYEESGSFKVRGFDMWTERSKILPEKQVQLTVDKGLAYVLGYRVDKPTATRIELDKSLDTRRVNNEGFYYNPNTKMGKLGNGAVAEVERVTGQVRVTKESVPRGATAGGTDYLVNSNVFKVEKVWTEVAGKTTEYIPGEDYQLVDSQAISWAPKGQEPKAGSTYFVTYLYNRELVENTDYKIKIQGEGDARTWYIDFNGTSGAKPLENTLVNVDYTFYLARIDMITLDSIGNYSVKKGQPNTLREVAPPNHLDPLTLQIGLVTLLPNSDNAQCVEFTITRLSMEDLNKIKRRVENLEYNEAINALDKGAMAGENPLTLRGVFSDGFISLDKTDISHPDNTIAFSFDDAHITLPYEEINKVKPNINDDNTNAHVWGRLVTAPFTEELAISQPFATKAMNINPYNVFNKQGMLELDPSSDNWIEEERITVTEQEFETRRVKRWWRHQGEDWAQDEKNSISDITLDPGQPDWEGQSYAYDVENGRTGTTLKSGGERTLEEAIEYMRQIDLQVSVQNLMPNSNNLRCIFDGIQIPMTPLDGYRSGSEPGTGISKADGTFKAMITIPPGIRCGTREITVKNEDNLAIGTFTAQGRKKVTEDVIIQTHVTVNLYDPLAQSFQFDTNRVVTSFEAFFASKDDSANVMVQVRGMSEGGQPNKTVYAQTLLKPSQIQVSDNASKATKITFDDPLMVEAGKEYCIVFITDSNMYTMWLAEMGENLVDKPDQMVTANPYVEGVLFSSSNASTWTPHQRSDLKFNVYTARFNEEAVMEFDVMRDVNADSIVLMSTYLTPQNTGCRWDMKMVLQNEPSNITVDSKPWQPIGNYVDIDVNQVAREVKLRATFKANRYISPMLSLQDIMFVGFLTALKGSYISRTIDMSEAPFNTARMSFEVFTPAGTTITPRYSLDQGKTWNKFKSSPTTKNQTEEFTRLEYVDKVTQGTAREKSVKVRIDMEANNSFLRPRARRLMVTAREE